jgi:hypothetical protein
MPVLSPANIERDVSLSARWRNLGDELHTDVAAISQLDATRAMVIQNSSNSIMPADHLRLREVQIGYEFPEHFLKGKYIKSLSLSAQVQNVAVWTRNKLHLDPETTSGNGTGGVPIPRNYVLSINMTF